MIIDSVCYYIFVPSPIQKKLSNNRKKIQSINLQKKVNEVTWNSYFYKLKSNLEESDADFRIFSHLKFAKKTI